MTKKPSWDDIPSLKLNLEEEDAPETPANKRTAVRICSPDLLNMLMVKHKGIFIQVATSKGMLAHKGVLQDLSQKGLCFTMRDHGLKKNDAVKILTILGKRPFKTNAIVRWTTDDQVGIEYVNPDSEDVSFLSELYSAKILNNI